MSFVPQSFAIPVSCRNIFLLLGFFLSALPCFAQQETPGRGTYPQGAYSLSDIEQINTTNGNVMFHVPVGSLPAGRNGLSAAVALHYNSKLWDSWFGFACDYNSNCEDNVQQLYASPTGGWRYGYQYQLQLLLRPQSYPCSDPRAWNIYRLVMNFPDGSSHEFRPYGYNDYGGDGYYGVSPNGSGIGTNCAPTTYTTGTMTYYSTDNTHLRLEIQHIASGPWTSNPWTLYLPNGGRITANEPGPNGPIVQRIYDANNNFVEVQNVILPNSNPANKLVDQLGRSVVIEHASTGDYIHSPGANGQTVTTTVTGKAINNYSWNNSYFVVGNSTTFDFGLPFIGGVDQIITPTQAGGYAYTFTYNIEIGSGVNGYGEVASVKLPSAEQNKAQTTYSYIVTGYSSADQVLNNPITQKTLKYLKQYDNPTTYDSSANYITETSAYNIPANAWAGSSSMTAPNGGVTSEWFYPPSAASWQSGLVYKTESPNGTVVERLWQPNTPQSPYLAVDINPYVKTEFVSIKNASGTLVKTAIKDYNYDKNGNLTQQVE